MRVTKRVLSATAAAILLAAIGISPVFARNIVKKKQQAREQFVTAQKLREALKGKPEANRTRREYDRVVEAYRKVYYTAPTSAKADEAVTAVAELLAEIGREFNDPRMLQQAIGQYEFLRREYPGSKFRVDALFTIGQIYKEDLNDKEQAKATFQEFLKRYPHSELKEEARKAIVELENPFARKTAKKAAPVSNADRSKKDREKQPEAETVTSAKSESKAPSTEKNAERQDDGFDDVKADKSTPLPVVTGIRHWSTPDYTRVAIDLDTEVKYEAGRIAHPDRIFFDLHDTKLASALVGKTFDVQDGFLKKIRVSQFQRGMTRIVLDVADVSDYSAFLLPNPYRLIIDIHGKKAQGPQTVVAKKQAADDANASEVRPEQPTIKAEDATTPKVASQSAEANSKDEKAIVAKAQKPEVKAAEKKVSELEKTLKQTEGDVTAEDTTITVAKATQPELKATPKPTTKPTFESVSPREDAKSKQKRRKRQAGTTAEQVAREARPTSNGERSLIRALGLKIGKIVVDAGHGGHDTGTIGPNGYYEKDLVLDVALRLGKLLEKNMGAEVVYTRNDDTFVPLETRTAIANQAQADMFISIHANSSRDPDARGVETYYLNFTSSPDALEVAARENAVSAKSIHELQDLVKKITLKDKIDESREFASDVQRSLYSGIAAKSPAVRNRGVKKAPFIVLIGANMPSILAEISFLSNPADEKRLQTPQYRQSIAEYLYRGVERYVSGLSGIKVASTSSASPVASKAPKQIDDTDR